MNDWQSADIVAAFLIFAAILGVLYLRGKEPGGTRSRRGGWPRRKPYRDSHQEWTAEVLPIAPRADIPHFAQQLSAVMEGAFQKRRIMNVSEYRVFRIVEATLAGSGHRVFAQPCLGEVLQSADEQAFRAINSKRVDMLIVDGGGWPVLALEYQGEGHYQGTAAARDAIKKEALRKAGVCYAEVVPADSDAQIRARLRGLLGWDEPVERSAPVVQPNPRPLMP